MKFCQKCGNQLLDEAVICPKCGCAVSSDAINIQKQMEETGGLATTALVFAILMPIVGLILGIAGVIRYSTSTYKSKCIGAIVASIIFMVTGVLLLTLAGL